MFLNQAITRPASDRRYMTSLIAKGNFVNDAKSDLKNGRTGKTMDRMIHLKAHGLIFNTLQLPRTATAAPEKPELAQQWTMKLLEP